MESSDSTDAQVQVPEQHPSTGTSEPFSTASPVVNQQSNAQANVQGNAQADAQASDQVKIDIPGAFSPGAIIGASYEIIELLGRGAMGMVYKVKHVSLPTEYALKILTDDKHDEVSVIRFQNEAQAIAKLNHPNIVAIYNFGVHESSLPFYVMDLLDGEDLLDKIVFSGPMTAEVALPLFIEASAGLSFAHRKGILHRDVKPANLLILDKPDVHGARVKVVDFGIVKFAEELKPEVQKLTAMGIVCGSPSYMSPEQAMGQRVDPRSDVYSLGCSLFEALTGKVPFRGRSASDTMMMHVSTPSPTLASKNPEGKFSDDLEMLVARMMAKEPMYRYQSMDAVALDLKNVLDGQPLGANAPASFRGATAESTVSLGLGSLGKGTKRGNDREEREDDLFDAEPYTDGQQASGEYQSESEYEEDFEEEEEAEEEASSSNKLKIVIASCALLSIIAVASFFVMQLRPTSSSSTATVDASGIQTGQKTEIKLDASSLNKDLHLEDASPEPDAAAKSIELTKEKYFSKSITVGGRTFTQFDFPPKSGTRPLAWIGTSLNDRADACGTLKFPRDKTLYLAPSPNVMLKKEFLRKFRRGDITEVIIWPPFASDDLAIECVNLPGIKGYNISGCSDLTAKIIPALNTLPNLEAFYAFKSHIKSTDFAKLRFLPNLKNLMLARCVNVTPILVALNGSRRLESLQLADTGIGPADYRLIANFSNLRTLILDGNKISSDDLHRLSGLSRLAELSLVKVHMKDGAVAKELVHFPSLKIIVVDKGHFKKTDLAYLRQHSPNLRVQFYSERSSIFAD